MRNRAHGSVSSVEICFEDGMGCTGDDGDVVASFTGHQPVRCLQQVLPDLGYLAPYHLGIAQSVLA